MRNGRIYWTAPESQFYAEPKKLAQAGYLTATTQPGRTHARTHYTLTDAGRDALKAWLATPDAASRASRTSPSSACWAAEYADRGELLASLNALREELDQLDAAMATPRSASKAFRTAQRFFASTAGWRSGSSTRTAQWLDEVEARAVKVPLQPFRLTALR